MSDLFARIRSACREVTARARFVAIDDAGLSTFADELAGAPWPEDDLDPAHHFAGDAETTLAFTLLLDAINFGSGWFPLLTKPDGLSGYRTVATACKHAFEAEGAPAPATLRAFDAERMAGLLGQSLADPEVARLMGLFAQAWRDFGTWLGQDFEDRYAGPVEAAQGSAARLVESLARMPLYRDVMVYDAGGPRLEVPLYKRAQISVADLHRAFPDHAWGRFADLDALTLFADNLVPHVLRMRSVLRYDPALLARIDAGTLLDVGSTEEVEIRAVALEAVERLVAALAERGREATAHALDGLLWNAGQDPAIKARPRHRARCSFY